MTLRVLGKVGVICGGTRGKKELSKQKQRQTEQNTAKNNKGV
jgi:hypothetical protein